MSQQSLKNISIFLAIAATLLLVIDLAHLKMVFDSEKGLLDSLPGILRNAMFIAYPVLLFISYVLCMFCRNPNGKFDFLPNVLFLLNGLALLILIFILVTGVVKNL